MVPSRTTTRFMPSSTIVASVCRRCVATRSRAFGNQVFFDEVGRELLSVQSEVRQPIGRGRLVVAFFAGSCARHHARTILARGQRQIARVLLDQPVARLVERDILLRELVDRLRDGRDQVRKALHLPDRAVHDRVEGPVHQRCDKLGKVQLVAQRAGATADRLGGGFAPRRLLAVSSAKGAGSRCSPPERSHDRTRPARGLERTRSPRRGALRLAAAAAWASWVDPARHVLLMTLGSGRGLFPAIATLVGAVAEERKFADRDDGRSARRARTRSAR